MQKLSVIMITWNAKHFLEKSLASVYEKNKGFNFELIVIDNHSTDGSIEFIESNYPDAILIKNARNRGVAPARNQGFKVANGKYFLILDVDTELITDNAFDVLYNYMEKNANVGVIGSKLIFQSGELQLTCRTFPSVWVKLFNRIENISFIKNSKMVQTHYMLDVDHNKIQVVDYVIGAFQLIRRSLIEEIGDYDEKIFYGPEDIDFCLRAKKRGYLTVYFPDVVLYHFYQRITKKLLTKITYMHFKGLVHYFFKHKYIFYPKI